MSLEQLGPYRITKRIGGGGMGTVYQGEEDATGRRVAIKVLAPNLAAQAHFRRRFQAEIETLEILHHPNIVKLYGYGEDGEQVYFSMELVDGLSLEDELRDSRDYAWREVAEIGVQVSQALKHAHDHGVIHRDLKPANLLVTPDRQIKLTDFGIARLFGTSGMTAAGSVIGTVDYMSPEQASGKPVRFQSDLFSLGCVLYTLLARRPPFASESVTAALNAVRREAPPSLESITRNVPPELIEIIDDLLQKDPERRIATALLTANRLRSLLHGLSGATVESRDWHTRPTTDVSGFEDRPTPADFEVDDSSFGSDEANAVTRDDSGRSPATDEPSEPIASKQTTFTAVDRDRPADEPRDGVERWKTAGLLAVLVCVASVFAYAVWPVSADGLFDRIRDSVDSGDAHATHELAESFLQRFPDDPRRDAVDSTRLDIESRWLQSRLSLRDLKSGGNDLFPYEQAFLEGMRKRQDDAEGSRRLFQAAVSEVEAMNSPAVEATELLSAARHQLTRLRATNPRGK